VEEKRLFTVDEEVVEHEPGARSGLRQENRHAIDALGDLIGSDIHRGYALRWPTAVRRA